MITTTNPSAGPGESRKTVAAVSVHPAELAATRLRVHQFLPSLRENGIDVKTWSFLRQKDLPAWYGRSQLARAFVLIRALLRLPAVWRTVRSADLILVQREALPFGPPIVELLFARRRKMVWDVDDSVWVPYVSPTAGRIPRWLRAPSDKYGRLCEAADEVWAGSEVLASWCRERQANVVLLPTVVDVPEYPPSRVKTRTLGWIGSHSTSPFIEQLLPTLREIDPAVRVIVVGGEPLVPDGLDCEIYDWSPDRERWALEQSWVGLYPVDCSHPMAEGKCGLKAILFMSAGLPAVVTPTTPNSAVVRDGIDGYHARHGEEWVRAIDALLRDEPAWHQMSRSAHERAQIHYSLARWAPVVTERLRSLLDS
jgi:glycosyltransferase involved in cell wall biosynthesis